MDSKTSQYAVAFVAGAIQEPGYKRILMTSDNEPAIKRLKERVSECLPGVECVPKEALVGDSRANGSTGEGQFRTLKIQQRTGTVAKLVRNLVCLLGSRDIVKSILPNTEKWLRKRYDENYNNDMSNETKRETNNSINNKCNDVNTRNTHIT